MEKIINPINISSGKIVRYKGFNSNFISSRIIDILLPDDYSTEVKYNLLIMHDGQMLFDSTNIWNNQEWCVDEWMEKLLKKKQIQNTIVVGVWNSGHNRHTDYFPNKPLKFIDKQRIDKIIQDSKKLPYNLFNEGVKSDQYLSFLVKELIPFLEKEFSLKKERRSRFIGGSSMGGLISLYAMLEYPDVFFGAICMSTHWPGDYPKDNEKDIPNAILKYLSEKIPPSNAHKIYFDYGTEGLDSFYGEYQSRVNTIFLNKGYDQTNFLCKHFIGHGHEEKYWAERLDIPLKFMLSNGFNL